MEQEIKEVTIFNTLGQRVFHQLFSTGQLNLEVETATWPKGIYQVQVNGLFVNPLVIH